MMRRWIYPVVLVLGFSSASWHALADEGATSSVEPQITIRREENKTFYEYRVNGVLKEIKVVPSVGPEYYLVPADGGGWIQEDRSQLLVPKWVIFSW